MNGRARLLLFVPGAAGTAALLIAGMLGLPGFGGAAHPHGDRSVRQSLEQDTVSAIASVTFDQRALDTVGEVLILLTAAVGALTLLRRVGRETVDRAGAHRHGPAEVPDALRVTGYLLLPPTLLVGVYVVAHGHQSPGGGFQGGVILGTAVHLLYLAGDYPALRRLEPAAPFEAGQALAAAVFTALSLAVAGRDVTGWIPVLNAAAGVEVGCALVLLVGKFFEQALLVHGTGRPGENA